MAAAFIEVLAEIVDAALALMPMASEYDVMAIEFVVTLLKLVEVFYEFVLMPLISVV